MGYCAASSDNFLPTFRDNLSGDQIGCPETSVRNYHYSLRNNPEEPSSQSTSKRNPEIMYIPLFVLSVRFHRERLYLCVCEVVPHGIVLGVCTVLVNSRREEKLTLALMQCFYQISSNCL